jgi:hypothetical protein
MIRRTWIALVTFVLLGATAFAQPPAPTDGFVPMSSLPPGEELPAGRFVVASYSFFLLLMVFYLWTIWKRLARVEQEMKELARRQGGATR